jgi:RsbT co-antagonist protein rsbRD N-terminal domain
MTLETLLRESEASILDEAFSDLQRSHGHHYEKAGEKFTRERLATLFDLVVTAIGSRSLSSLSAYADRIATERFDAGFDISEVQMAFNSLEEAMWRRVVDGEPPNELAEAIGLLSTVLGFGKDTVARKYVSLASQKHVPTLDLKALFSGAIEGSPEG